MQSKQQQQAIAAQQAARNPVPAAVATPLDVLCLTGGGIDILLDGGWP